MSFPYIQGTQAFFAATTFFGLVSTTASLFQGRSFSVFTGATLTFLSYNTYQLITNLLQARTSLSGQSPLLMGSIGWRNTLSPNTFLFDPVIDILSSNFGNHPPQEIVTTLDEAIGDVFQQIFSPSRS